MADIGKKGKTTTAKNPLCFVIGPIGKEGTPERKHSDFLLHAIIKQVLQQDEFGYIVKRADEDADPGMIGDRVVSDIINAELVVADLTDLNPNAFYELGIRHSTEQPTIHIAKASTQLPFDNITHRTIFVDISDWSSVEQARNRLAESTRAVKAPNYRVSNPITQANASFKMRQSEDPRERLIAEMHERLTDIEANLTAKPSRSRRLRNQDDVANKIGAELRKLWRGGMKSAEIEVAAKALAADYHVEINNVELKGSDLFFDSPQLDISGYSLDWEERPQKGS